MDADLEAFSHYPANGNFAAMPCQTAAKNTCNHLNQRFLPYYSKLTYHSVTTKVAIIRDSQVKLCVTPIFKSLEASHLKS
jgi:hypothetical protein